MACLAMPQFQQMSNLLLSMYVLEKESMNFPQKKDQVDGIKTRSEVNLGSSSEFSSLSSDNMKIFFSPKKQHVGEYNI